MNIGTSELIFIAAIALLVLGPERLPKLAKGVGRFFRELRRQTDDVRTAVEREFYKLDEDVESGNAPHPLTPNPDSLPQGGETPADDPPPAAAVADAPPATHVEPPPKKDPP